THRQAADRVELDTLFGGEIDDGLAHDGEAGAGVDRVLAVDVVIAGLSTRELERDVTLFVAALDHVECVLPGSSHRGNGNEPLPFTRGELFRSAGTGRIGVRCDPVLASHDGANSGTAVGVAARTARRVVPARARAARRVRAPAR